MKSRKDETLKKFRLKKRRRKRELACVVACFVIGRDTHYTSFFSTRIYIYTHIYVSLRACIYAYVKNYFPPHSLLYVYFCYLRSDFGLSACRVMRDIRQWCSGSDCVIDVSSSSSSSSTSRTIDTDPLRGQECT